MTMGLGPYSTSSTLGAVFTEMAVVRAGRGLPALTAAHVGAEWLRAEEDAPRVVIVPVSNAFATARNTGNQTGITGDFNPKSLFRRLSTFEAYLWGDDKPADGTEATTWYSFDSAVELERELLVALAHNLGGPAAIIQLGSTWDQPTDMNRRGRLLVTRFAFETPVTQEPYITLPYSTASTSGVQISTTIEMLWPDGTSTIAGVIVSPP